MRARWCIALLLSSCVFRAAGTEDLSGSAATAHYVTSSLRVGGTAAEVDSFALDLDGDGVVDNKLGRALLGLTGTLGVSADALLALEVGTGAIIILHSVTSGPGGASWAVYPGAPQRSPDFSSGHGMFALAGEARPETKVGGAIVGADFSGGEGTIELPLSLNAGMDTVLVPIVGARIEAAGVGPDAFSLGVLAGGVPRAEIEAKVLPLVAGFLDGLIENDGECRARAEACSSRSIALLALFDADHDRVISAGEVSGSTLVQSALEPDLDLLGDDGVPDSLSIGFGMTGAGAVFSVPWE